MGLTAAKSADRGPVLQWLRDRLITEVEACDDQRLLPALVLRLTDILAQIDEMPTAQKVSRADEIAQRRAARRGAGTSDPARPAANPG